jgi:DNA polymerase-1
MVSKLEISYGKDIFFFLDGKEKLRYELFPPYKQKRVKKEEDKDGIEPLKEALKEMNCTTVMDENSEADDAIATFVSQNKKDKNIIISSDKDLWSLIGGKTQVICSSESISLDKVLAEFGTPAKGVPVSKALFGDSSDNLPGVPYLKRNDVALILKNCNDLDDFLNQTGTLKENVQEKLSKFEERIRLIYKVASLRTNCELKLTSYTKR